MVYFSAVRIASKAQLRRQWMVGRLWHSTSSAPKLSPSASGTKTIWGTGAVIAAGGGIYWLSSKPAGVTRLAVPIIKASTSEEEIPVVSPVKVLDLESANAKLREQAQSFVFDSADGEQGRLDVVRVASNDPVEDEWSMGIGGGIQGEKTLYAGIMDGHAGWATSKVLKEALIPYVSSSLGKISFNSPEDDVDAAIKRAFTNLDNRIMTNARRAAEASHEPGSAEAIAALAPALAGSCALLTMYEPKSSTLRTAVTGDSRAVLGSWSAATETFSAQALSKDQTGFNEEEVKRLNAEHPGEGNDILDAETGRLLGIAVTRGFGDHRWKWTNDFIRYLQSNFYGSAPRPKSKTPPYMTASPEVTTRRVASSDFVILASDGLWDVMSNEDAVTCVSRWLAARRKGRPEQTDDIRLTVHTLDDEGFLSYKATPEYFAIEDLDNAAVCLVKNALGGRRRGLFCGAMTVATPMSRYMRDDITVQVVFFKDP
ncbi:protein serine/threonine phosphatase 2C [Trichoderma citrinoviride]|uniref:Protein serine/threonine phosphatase 2C n=1 Tax=Trichoderma citrinoviride TaxID=58853 RepID=A0A2T4B1S4_9HYPO|nr:protein serine/threonine phosphatase 2C [Trichoderma citrinoviride]PTB63276.1 protein serine/threonine phosphatase 2C [Trichoderma citrinoviride]